MDLRAREDEHFLGLGERFDRLDQRGNVIALTVVNGASGVRTYAPIPFYISTAGYGLQLLGSTPAILHMAPPDDPAVVSIRCAAPSLAFRVIPGGSPKEILSQYTGFTGRPALPPAWVFGPWKSRDWTTDNQSRVAEDITKARELRLAGTVELIDASWQPYYHSFSFDPSKFPGPAGMIRHARSQGYRLVLWVSPWLVWSDPPTENYRLCAERGYFIKTPSGDPYVHRLANSPTFLGSCFDFTHPGAVAWWQEQIRRLARMGIDGFKTDFGEQIPADARFADGRTGHEVHNEYPVLYAHATHTALQAETRGILLSRAAWDGSQAVTALWAGDQSSDCGPATGLPSVIVAAQSAGSCGFPFWASDIGGYFGTPTDEVFIRWAQFGALSPIMQIHGLGRREPWDFGPETLAIYKRYAQLHVDLFLHHTHAQIATATGIPIMRALALEFPDDPRIWGDSSAGIGQEMIEHEYCFGDALLVAPVYWSGDRVRHLYLPDGQWRDFWSGEMLEGGRVHRRDAPLEVTPMYARAGAIIPLLDPSADTLLPTDNPALRVAGDDLRLLIFAGANGSTRLYDGTRFAWDDAAATLTVEGTPSPGRLPPGW
jgi:alpha-D-xyloside xylohydrolase